MADMIPNWCGCAPLNGFAAEAWFVRKRWERGACPCCGSRRLPEVPIAEGVLVCGGCAVPGHLRDSQGWQPLLAAAATNGTTDHGT